MLQIMLALSALLSARFKVLSCLLSMTLEVDILVSPILQVRNLKLREASNLGSYRISKNLSLDGNLEF